ncbi:MAG: dihydrodipicolinate synthase family protein [Spirochaetaceae bacterium]|nr:dihydrodipicolinate synthase family protein [Spirochaetaceae bacterium]MCF7939452.1 dihydrodipicolinate synthase family protein [Spirochaetales bacterium]
MKISTFTALITAFKEDESINYPRIAEEVQRQIIAGNDIFACGTNGDFSSMTFAERVKVAETCSEAVNGKARLIANAGCPSTNETLLLGKELANIGVDAVAVITPYFIACTQEGLYRHYSRIADSLSVPVYIYEIPARTGNSIDISTVARLAEHPNIKGIKDSSGKTERLDGLSEIAANNPSFEFYAGIDSLILYGLRKGAAGCVSGLANVIPDWIHAVAEAFTSGSEEEADKVQEKVNDFRTALYAPGYPPAMVKRVLYLMDSEVGNNRLPALVPNAETDAALEAVIDNYGLKRV